MRNTTRTISYTDPLLPYNILQAIEPKEDTRVSATLRATLPKNCGKNPMPRTLAKNGLLGICLGVNYLNEDEVGRSRLLDGKLTIITPERERRVYPGDFAKPKRPYEVRLINAESVAIAWAKVDAQDFVNEGYQVVHLDIRFGLDLMYPRMFDAQLTSHDGKIEIYGKQVSKVARLVERLKST